MVVILVYRVSLTAGTKAHGAIDVNMLEQGRPSAATFALISGRAVHWRMPLEAIGIGQWFYEVSK